MPAAHLALAPPLLLLRLLGHSAASHAQCRRRRPLPPSTQLLPLLLQQRKPLCQGRRAWRWRKLDDAVCCPCKLRRFAAAARPAARFAAAARCLAGGSRPAALRLPTAWGSGCLCGRGLGALAARPGHSPARALRTLWTLKGPWYNPDSDRRIQAWASGATLLPASLIAAAAALAPLCRRRQDGPRALPLASARTPTAHKQQL